MADADLEISFFDIFKRFSPDGAKRALLERAVCTKKDFRIKRTEDGERILRVEVDLRFSRHEDPELLYEISDECAALYELESFRIIPHFPPEIFDISYFHEIVTEATLCGAVTSGFFSRAEFKDDGETVTVLIPFRENGVRFVRDAGTEALLSNILQSRYGLVRRVVISENGQADDFAEQIHAQGEKRLAEAIAAGERAAAEQIRQKREEQQAAAAEDPRAAFSRKSGIMETTGVAEDLSPTSFRRGSYFYRTDGATPLYGEEDFEIVSPMPLADLEKAGGRPTVFLGTVFDVQTKDIKNGERVSLTFGISDVGAAAYVRKIFQPEETEWIGGLKKGMDLAVLGRLRRDKFDNEPYLDLLGIKKIRREDRTDRAPEKRVELHLHTNMSQMDAIITPAEVVETAIRWGHKAIAVTDHGNVQAFPEVMLALEAAQKKDREKGRPVTDLKILYGTEAYFVNDTARCIFGSGFPAFDEEMIVFDIETTGLSNTTCKIIEIGAVKIKNGEILDVMDTFVDPGEPIPEKITELTSITDEMVAGAPDEKTAVKAFLDFAGGRMLIAHNANFDVGFIRVASERWGYDFHNPYLDTVGLSKYVNPELKRHKLDVIAEHYHLGDFHHHRASDDAEMLARVFFVMLSRLRAEGIGDFGRMMDAMSERSDPLKIRPHHMIIFAKNKAGLKNLYKLISFSYLQYFHRFPRMPKSVIEQYRDGLIIGSACEAGELYRAILEGRSRQDIEEIASFYDYLEIQPLCNNRFLIDEGTVPGEERLKEINLEICELGERLGKPVCATCDAHFLNPEDEIFRRVILAGQKFKDADRPTPIYLRTTEEMLAEFSYLGEERARRVVIENPNKIADLCERFRPIPEGRYEPDLPGAKEELVNSCWQRAHEWYGDPLPEVVEARLKRELDSIIGHGFAVLYMIAVKLVAYSESLGYQVGSRGSVGSSFVATMSGISEVNPLPPHYRCPKCRHSEFFLNGEVGSGFDLPDKDCPECGTPMIMDGHDIPFETFLGFKGDKSPDIDLNFSGDVQGKVHKYTEELFGEGHVFRAGTIGTLADKTAWGYVSKYLDEHEVTIPKAEIGYMSSRLMGIKRTTSQHPGGIIVVPREFDIYDFSPIQHPADDPNSDIITTHFQFTYLHDTILKLDELGHDMPTKYKMLEKYTNTSVLDVKMNDRSIYELFETPAPLGIGPEDIGGCKIGTFGVPEMGTRFVQQVLIEAKPKNFADLLQVSGLTHGTAVWLGNAQDLIKDGTCTISEVVGTRDSIMLYLLRHGLEPSTAFGIMEKVRKGKGVAPDYEADMLAHGVPEWYIASCKKIKYMFPKAHAAAYVMSAIRLCWYKIYYPMEFYAAFLSVAPGGFNAEIVAKGIPGVSAAIREVEEKGTEASAKDNELASTMQLVREALARGITFLNVDLQKSDATAFLPENGRIRMPFSSLPGLGETAAQKIIEARDRYEIYSVEDLKEHTGISKATIEILRQNHVLDGLSETNQFSMF